MKWNKKGSYWCFRFGYHVDCTDNLGYFVNGADLYMFRHNQVKKKEYGVIAFEMPYRYPEMFPETKMTHSEYMQISTIPKKHNYPTTV